MRKAIPNDLKWACSPRPWHGYSSSHSKKYNFFNINLTKSKHNRLLSRHINCVPEKFIQFLDFVDTLHSIKYFNIHFGCHITQHKAHLSQGICTVHYYLETFAKEWTKMISVTTFLNFKLILINQNCKLVYFNKFALNSPKRPNNSTPRAAKMKNNKKNRSPRLPT